MKTLLLSFLLGRGVSKVQELLSKLVRHGLGWAGGMMMGWEWAMAQDVQAVLTNGEGLLLALVSILLSAVRTFLPRYVA